MTASVGVVGEILVGISHRTIRMVELKCQISMQSTLARLVKPCGCSLCWLGTMGVLSAVKVVMVLMTFDGALQGMPVAAVLVK